MKKYFPIIGKTLIKLTLLGASGGTIFLTDSVPAIGCAVSVIASVLSSSLSDKQFKVAMTIVNLLASNLDKAQNNPDKNKI